MDAKELFFGISFVLGGVTLFMILLQLPTKKKETEYTNRVIEASKEKQ